MEMFDNFSCLPKPAMLEVLLNMTKTELKALTGIKITREVIASSLFKYKYEKKMEKYTFSPWNASQPEITPKMRAILFEWLVELTDELKMSLEIYFLAVKLTDLYLNRVFIKKSDLQLLGCVCFVLANESFDRFDINAKTMIIYSANSFEETEYEWMKKQVKKTLDTKIPTIYNHIVSKKLQNGIATKVYAGRSSLFELSLETLCLYVACVSLMHIETQSIDQKVFAEMCVDVALSLFEIEYTDTNFHHQIKKWVGLAKQNIPLAYKIFSKLTYTQVSRIILTNDFYE